MGAGSIFEERENPQGEFQEIKQCFLRTPLQSLLLRKIAQMKRSYSDPKFRRLEIRRRVALVEDTA